VSLSAPDTINAIEKALHALGPSNSHRQAARNLHTCLELIETIFVSDGDLLARHRVVALLGGAPRMMSRAVSAASVDVIVVSGHDCQLAVSTSVLGGGKYPHH
jgi:hypothetical protein